MALLVRERFAPALVVLGADVFLLVTGVVSAEEALSGFANPAPFTVAALYVVARAVEKTGGLQPLVAATLGEGRGGRTALSRLLLPVAGASAFLNNTPIVAMVTPQVSAWADRRGEAASRYLMPLSFAAIFGGLCTVIGTSTTIVVSGLLEASGRPAIGMFEIGRIGLPVALVGVAVLVVLAPRLLPERRAARRQLAEDVKEFSVNMVVERGGALDGRTVEEGGLRHLHGVFLVEIRRGEEVIAPATPTTTLRGGDELTFVGRADQVLDLDAKRGLRSAEHEHAVRFHDAGHTYFEAVIGAGSPLVGKTLREVEFRSTYGAAVLAIHRSGERLRAQLGGVRLRHGDTLLLLSDAGFEGRWGHRTDFLLVSHLGGMAPASSRQAWGVAAVLVGIVGTAATGLLPILHASLVGVFLLMAFRILTPVEARRAVDLDVVILIAAAFGLGAAIQASGLAGVLADGIFAAFSGLGPWGVLLGVVLATVVLTELVTNNAAAILVFPIAVAAAAEHGLDPRPFALAVAVAASASFLTPIGYQTNTMVYGPGGYRFGDYARLGWPLTLLVIVMVVVMVPILWPL